MTSLVVHAGLLIALAMWKLALLWMPQDLQLSSGFLAEEQALEALNLAASTTVSEAPDKVGNSVADLKLDAPAVEHPALEQASSPAPDTRWLGLEGAAKGNLSADPGNPGGGGLAGRSKDARPKLVKEQGGNEESEMAVRRGLDWLAAHQEDNGRWRFNHHLGPCNGYCRDPGTEPSTTGATALALLAFLGAGQTHHEGEYQAVVKRGLYYLQTRMIETKNGGDLQEGTMYAHGLAAIALCEAAAMTQDRDLSICAQRALDFIAFAQDKKGGGWRYHPGQPGDTSMLGWQLMAQRSGQMAYLEVPADSARLAEYFLDKVGSDNGALYGYQAPGNGRATTAIGLLSRMYLGWRRDNPSLERGVRHLDKWGPSKDDMYYNYYATQVLHHWGAKSWEKWNPKMRDYLIATQSRERHETGSWTFSGVSAEAGGRLYNTALSIMILEVYYRHLPLYRTESLSPDF